MTRKKTNSSREVEPRMKGLFPEQLNAGDYTPVVTAYYYKQWAQYEMTDHSHRSMEIMYVIGGHCLVEVGEHGPNRSTVTMKKGEFIILDASVPHRLVVETSCRMLNVEFRFTERKGILPSMKKLAEGETTLARLIACSHSFLLLREPHDVYHVLKSLVIELDSHGRREMMVQLLLAELLLRIAAIYRETEAHGEPGRDRYVQLAIEYLNENYDQDLRVPDVARIVNLHPAYLQKIFKQVTGQSVSEYLTVHRMEKAKMLLRQTDVPIMDIADYVGVGSRQYLHHLFKRHTGITPAEYRRQAESQRFATEQSYQY